MSLIDETAARLATHEEICLMRYTSINDKMELMDTRFDKIEQELKELKDSNSKTLNEIKDLLVAAHGEKFKVMITVAGTIIVSLIGLMGYLVIHLK